MSVIRSQTAPIRTPETAEALTVMLTEQDALADRCTALLTKNVLDNTASLCAYAEHLCSIAPSGKAAYETIIKAYAYNAVQRIIERRDY